MELSQANGSLELESRVRPSPQPAHTSATINDDIDVAEDFQPQLQPADGGLAAWRMLATAFVFEALMWGFPLSFGVFQNYYSQLPEFEGNPYISVVGTVASGISYLGAPFVTPYIRRYSKYRLHMILVGWPLCIISLIAGSFAKTLASLIIAQGIMYGIGFLIFYYPIISMIDEFWVRRRGMAYGILCCSSGLSGTVMPLIIDALLRKYGYQTTLRAIAIALLILTGPLIPMLKGRLPTAEPGLSARTNWNFLKMPLFWIYCVSNIIQGMGYFFPSLYLPSYASSIGLSPVNGALLLTVMSVSQVLGQFSFGYLSDHKLSVNVLMAISSLITAAATFTSWGIATNMPPLIVFSMFFGFFGAGYTALWARMTTAISEDPSSTPAIFGIFNFGKGVGNVLAGPLSAALILPATDLNSYGILRYKPLVIFTGVCMFMSAVSIGIKYLKLK